MKADTFAFIEDVVCRVNCWLKDNVKSYSKRLTAKLKHSGDTRPSAF